MGLGLLSVYTRHITVCHSVAGRIHGGVEVLEQEEGGDDDEDQEECVVVEDGEGGGLVVGHLVLLPQDPESSVNTKRQGSVPAENDCTLTPESLNKDSRTIQDGFAALIHITF